MGVLEDLDTSMKPSKKFPTRGVASITNNEVWFAKFTPSLGQMLMEKLKSKFWKAFNHM